MERGEEVDAWIDGLSPHVPIIFSWVSLIVVGEGGSKRRKNTTKRCFQFFTTKRARGERMNGRVRVVRRIHDEAITTFFAGEVMCYWGATRCNLCLHAKAREFILYLGLLWSAPTIMAHPLCTMLYWCREEFRNVCDLEAIYLSLSSSLSSFFHPPRHLFPSRTGDPLFLTRK